MKVFILNGDTCPHHLEIHFCFIKIYLNVTGATRHFFILELKFHSDSSFVSVFSIRFSLFTIFLYIFLPMKFHLLKSGSL